MIACCCGRLFRLWFFRETMIRARYGTETAVDLQEKTALVIQKSLSDAVDEWSHKAIGPDRRNPRAFFDIE